MNECGTHGYAISTNGECSCSCDPTFVWPECVCSRYVNCSAHGDAFPMINNECGCNCDDGYAGSNCECTRENTCSGHGTPVGTEGCECNCDAGYTGHQCNSCDEAGSR